jgi:hypothetical protein
MAVLTVSMTLVHDAKQGDQVATDGGRTWTVVVEAPRKA